MAYEAIGQDLGTFTAAADLSAKQFHFVVLASATTVVSIHHTFNRF